MEIRRATQQDLQTLVALYAHLKDEPPAEARALAAAWQSILAQQGHSVLLGEAGGEAVASCVLVMVPNLTHGARPYALVENVVTAAPHRRRGYAGQLLAHAAELARQAGCYKMMLMTGARDEATLRFYEGAGFNRQDKTAFIRWL